MMCSHLGCRSLEDLVVITVGANSVIGASSELPNLAQVTGRCGNSRDTARGAGETLCLS